MIRHRACPIERLNEELAADRRILDLGCGGAGLPADLWLIWQGHRVIGLGLSDEMLTLARRNVPRARYERRDMATLKAGDYSADAVVCFFAMILLDRSLHREFLRCLRS